jgi:diacylglycerol kinase family enzyme
MPDARLDDGRLDVVVLAPAGLPGWADIGYRIALGSRRDDAQLERYQARTVEIHAQGPGPGVAAQLLPRQLDGEIVEASSTLSVRILPAALLVRVPAASR